MDKVLEITDLEKKYDNFMLNKISFSIDRGYIMGYIGPNGAGKTTTIKAILDIISTDGGTIKLFGKSVTNDIKQKVGFVFGENAFYEFMSAEDMAGIISKFYNNWDWISFKKNMKAFNLDFKQKIETYSKGMKIKYMLACALSHNAELFILDEPTSGLDPVFRSELMEIFQSIISDGEKTILFSTHITSDLDKIADFVTFINNGNIIFSEDKDSLIYKYSIIKGGKELKTTVLESGRTLGIIDSNLGFSALTNQKDWFNKNLNNKIVIDKATLEDIMIHFVRGERNERVAI